MRPGWYLDPEGQKLHQSMRNEKGEQLGLVSILKARGSKHLSVGGHELNKVCGFCKAGISREARIEDGVNDERCCLTYVLSQEPDFMEQQEWLTDVVENGDCKIIFYPKYHCELNFIEWIWGWLKSYHRRSCTYNFKHLEEGLPITIEERLPVAFVRRAFQHCFRFMDGYRQGLTGPILEYAVKKYSSHRAIPNTIIKETEKEYGDREKAKCSKTLHK